MIGRRKRFEIHLITKMSDMTGRFEVILTSISSDKCKGQFKFKINWLFVKSANELVRVLKCSKQILLRDLSPIVCSTSVSSHG